MTDALKEPEIPRLYRLSEAVELFFPPGEVSVKTLRSEARRGRLEMITLGNKNFVTADAINEMLKRCAVPASEGRGATTNTHSATVRGLSMEERSRRARDALNAMLPPRARRIKDF